MKNELLTFLSQFPTLTEEDIELLITHIPIKSYKKGDFLIKEGEKYDKCYFILKGCVRQYYLQNGEEKTTGFFTEKQSVTSFSEYSKTATSSHYLACVEDCLLIVGNSGNEQEMYEKFPKLIAITRLLMEEDFGKTQENFASFKMSSPEERYLNLLETRPYLLDRVPQHQLASYLGMKPESLSRIRKRISVKK